MFGLSDEELKKLAWFLFQLLKRHLAESGGPSKAPLPRLLTVEQAADYIGRTKSAVEHMIHRGELSGCLVRRDRRVHLDRLAIDRWLDTHRI